MVIVNKPEINNWNEIKRFIIPNTKEIIDKKKIFLGEKYWNVIFAQIKNGHCSSHSIFLKMWIYRIWFECKWKYP